MWTTILQRSNAKMIFDEQAKRRTELLNKVEHYLSMEVINENEQTWNSLAKGLNDFEMVSNAGSSSSATAYVIKISASERCLEMRQILKKVEMSFKQLRERQKIERDAEINKLESRQALDNKH